MFFKKKAKDSEKLANELRVLWVHDHATYLTYVDDCEPGKKEIYFEGPHVKGTGKIGDVLLVLDCNGNPLGKIQLNQWETRKQGTLLGSVNTGEYLQTSGALVSGDKFDMLDASMLVNGDFDYSL